MPQTIGTNLLRYLGLVGGAGANTGLLVPRASSQIANQQLFRDFEDSGAVADPDIWTKYNSTMKRPATYDSMLQLWEEMADWDLLHAALVEIVDEATAVDANSPGSLWYQCNDKDMEEELNGLLVKLDSETNIRSQVWNVAALGNHFEKIEYAPTEGVIGLSFVHPMDMRRYWLERTRKCIGFKWAGHKPDKEPVFVAPDNQSPVERVALSTGKDMEQLYYPWDFCFTGDTKISLADGRDLSLEQLEKVYGAGEFWVHSIASNGQVVRGCAHTLKCTQWNAETVEIELDNGEKIKCTPNHRFMLRDGSYREAGKLTPNDSLMPLYSDFDHKVVAVRPNGRADVYDFEVDDYHNFALSAGVFVHNCHMRRMYRQRVTEHGEPIFAEAEGIYKKLRIAIDQMVVHRAQVQPDRYAINIDVQEQPPAEQMKTVQRWRQQLRAKLAFGQAGQQAGQLNQPSDFSSYYNAWALDTILYVAQPKNFNHVVNKIQGTTQIPDVYDIELLTDLFYSIIGMPRSWFGGQKDETTSPSGKALLAQDIRFLRKIKSIRSPIIQAYVWLGYFHAVLRGKNLAELDIRALMPPIGSLEDQMKLEMLKMQTEVLDMLADVMAKYRLPKEAWIETIFKRYLHLPDDVINLFITALPAPSEGAEAMQGESLGGQPDSRTMLREVKAAIECQPRLEWLLNRIKRVGGGLLEHEDNKRYRKIESLLPKLESLGLDTRVVTLTEGLDGHKSWEPVPPMYQTHDLVASGGKQVMGEALAPHSNNGDRRKIVSESKSDEPAYRRYMPEKF